MIKALQEQNCISPKLSKKQLQHHMEKERKDKKEKGKRKKEKGKSSKHHT